MLFNDERKPTESEQAGALDGYMRAWNDANGQQAHPLERDVAIRRDVGGYSATNMPTIAKDTPENLVGLQEASPEIFVDRGGASWTVRRCEKHGTEFVSY